MQNKLEAHRRFWSGEGPCLMLIPADTDTLYNSDNYCELFHSPELMLQDEMRRARKIIHWPTDGIPTIRPNVGVIFAPAIAGQSYTVLPGQMPWPGECLTKNEIRSIRKKDLQKNEIMKLAKSFYDVYESSEENKQIAAYLPDTQGIFDIAHLLYGDEIFYDMADDNQVDWMMELLDICTELYVQITSFLKSILHEDDSNMIHGHGTPQGVFFPHAGVRMSEDTATLLSPEMIERFILPFIKKGAKPFGGIFVHYCGKHEKLFETICRLPCVKAIDLGNPELYDTRWVLECCNETDTILYSRISAKPEETWQVYVNRLGKLASETRARCIVRPMVFPTNPKDAAFMLDVWHELTESSS